MPEQTPAPSEKQPSLDAEPNSGSSESSMPAVNADIPSAMLQAVWEQALDAVILCNLNRDIIGMNTAAETLFGHPRSALIGQKTTALYADPMEFLRQGRLRFNRDASAEHATYIVEYKKADGTVFPGETRGTVLLGPDGNKLGFMGVIRDATNSQAIEQIVSESNERLMALAEHAPVAVAMWDKNMHYVAASRRWRELFHIPNDIVLGRNHYDLCPQTPEHWRQAFSQCVHGRVQRVEDDPVDWLNDSACYMTWEMRPWYTIDGQLGGIVMYAEDVTARIQAEEIRARQHSLLCNIVDLIPYHVFWKDRDSRFLGCNQLFAKAAGFDSPDSIVGLTDLDMPWAETDAKKHIENDQAIMAEGDGTLHVEESLRTESGETIVISTSKLPLKDAHGEVVGVLGIFADVTKDKQMQDAMRLAKDAAEAANQAKSDFLANMSHEIRTPMTAILGFADVLLADEKAMNDAELRRDSLGTIKRNGEHLLSLINDILDLSKIEAGKMDMHMEPVGLKDLLQQVIDLIRVRAESKRIGLMLEMAEDLPIAVETDAKRIRQVLVNLLGNAIKFTEIGQVSLHAEAKETGDGHCRLTLSVTDTGIGMGPKQLSRLFKPFEMGDSSASRRYGGTGLGLAISKRLSKMLGGDIAVKSTEGQGSCFTFTFQAKVLDASALPSPEQLNPSKARLAKQISNACEPAPAAQDIEKSLLNVRILLAEDGLDNQRLIRHLLKRQGAIVSVAENGRLALDRYEQDLEEGSPFDLILMDMQMPQMDGYEATRTLRRSGHQTPVIALTAHAMTGDRQACIQAGCNDYLSKPVNAQELVATCLHWLQKQNSQAA